MYCAVKCYTESPQVMDGEAHWALFEITPELVEFIEKACFSIEMIENVFTKPARLEFYEDTPLFMHQVFEEDALYELYVDVEENDFVFIEDLPESVEVFEDYRSNISGANISVFRFNGRYSFYWSGKIDTWNKLTEQWGCRFHTETILLKDLKN